MALTAACSAAPSDPNAIQGKFDVGGRSIWIDCHGTGSPTVVFDAGLGNTHETWRAVAPAVAATTRTCTYDRANRGSSDAAQTPRSSSDVVNDLAAALAAAAIKPPFILVGHSFGGIDMRLFASTHPADIVGLVLVDPTPTTFPDDECAIVDPPLCARLREGFGASSNPEGLDFIKSGVEIDAAAALPEVPLVVLAATVHHQAAVTDPGFEQQIEAAWQADEGALASSVPGGTLKVVESGHDIQTLHPQAVIDAVADVVTRVRSGS